MTKLQSWLVTARVFSHTFKIFSKILKQILFKNNFRRTFLYHKHKYKQSAKYSYQLGFIRLTSQSSFSCLCFVKENKIQLFQYFTHWNEITRRCFMQKYSDGLLKPSFKERFANLWFLSWDDGQNITKIRYYKFLLKLN